MSTIKLAAMTLIGVTVCLVLAGQVGLWSGSEPTNLGVKNGRLLPPTISPNSVSSQSKLYPEHPRRQTAYIAPIAYQGTHVAAMEKLLQTLKTTPGIKLVEVRADYVYAQASTPWMKFKDDLEFWFDDAQPVVQIRSASRLGESDLGTNRTRMEDIRARFNR